MIVFEDAVEYALVFVFVWKTADLIQHLIVSRLARK